MTGAYTATGFDYDNYSNGRWGFHVGTSVGKQWSKFSMAGFVEVLRTFGSDNYKIDIVELKQIKGIPAIANIPDEISVDLKSTTEVNAGFKAFYQIDDRWSLGGGLTYKHHADNGVEGLATELNAQNNPTIAYIQKQFVDGLMPIVEDMNDGFDEYVLNLTGAYQLNDTTQVAVYGEYTFDTAHAQSQNGTDVKAELGVRLNVQF